MTKLFQYDLFISYSTVDAEIATYVCSKLESKGLKCFIAPRDITLGKEYAGEIIRGVSNSSAVLLIFSSTSDKSGYVLREINSAVSRNKTIIPLRIENFLPSEAMEFYLGPTQWLDAFPKVLDTHIDSVISMVKNVESSLSLAEGKPEATKEIIYKTKTIISLEKVLELGYTYNQICMRELELDYLSVPQNKFIMDDTIEGTVDDWAETIKNDADKTCFLVDKDQIVGYSDAYLLNDGAFDELANGTKIIRDEMLAFYLFGGEFDVYLPLFSFEPNYINENNCILFLKWTLNKFMSWENQGIKIKRVGASSYSTITDRIFFALGFKHVADNPANGKVFVSTYETLKASPLYNRII